MPELLLLLATFSLGGAELYTILFLQATCMQPQKEVHDTALPPFLGLRHRQCNVVQHVIGAVLDTRLSDLKITSLSPMVRCTVTSVRLDAITLPR